MREYNFITELEVERCLRSFLCHLEQANKGGLAGVIDKVKGNKFALCRRGREDRYDPGNP